MVLRVDPEANKESPNKVKRVSAERLDQQARSDLVDLRDKRASKDQWVHTEFLDPRVSRDSLAHLAERALVDLRVLVDKMDSQGPVDHLDHVDPEGHKDLSVSSRKNKSFVYSVFIHLHLFNISRSKG